MKPPAFLAEVAAVCEPYLRERLADPGVPADLAAAMRHSVLGGGKRLRPALCLAAAQACGAVAAQTRLLPAACAMELIHAYSLVHDDLPAMDDAELRRGRPACHRAFGEAVAILAGDALQALAFASLAQPLPGVRPEDQLAAVATLGQAAGAAGMCGGQALDLAAEVEPPDDAGLWRLQAMKTGALLGASVQIGARLAGADAATFARLAACGEGLGAAFQITDDILDVTASDAAWGKTPGSDARGGKVTAVSRLGLDGARARAAEAAAAAVAAVEPLGPRASVLADLARYAAARRW